MLILKALKEKPILALSSSITMFLLYPVVQMFITPLAFDMWMKEIWQRTLNFILYLLFSILFGIFTSFYAFIKNKCFNCNRRNIMLGISASTLGLMLGICPACFPFIIFILPIGLLPMLLINAYSHFFLSLAIALTLFSIYKLGGFR